MKVLPSGRSAEKLDIQTGERSITRMPLPKKKVFVKDSLHLSVALSEGTFDQIKLKMPP